MGVRQRLYIKEEDYHYGKRKIKIELLFALKTMKAYLVFLFEPGRISGKLKL